MKRTIAISTLLAAALALFGCNSPKFDAGNLKLVETRKVGDINIVLMNETGELTQGQNSFVVQFQDAQRRPVDVGEVQFGSSMVMPSMAPMSGESEITPAGATGAYRVKSNFAMSGAWHFTIGWKGSRGEGKTAFNSNVR